MQQSGVAEADCREHSVTAPVSDDVQSLSSGSRVATSPQGVNGDSDRIGTPENVRRGISVRYDPRTGGLSGLPESWAGMLPDGCTPDKVGDGELPAALRPGARASPGLKLTDSMIVGKPFNVHKWRPSFGVPLEITQTVTVHGFEIPRVLECLREALLARGGLSEEGIFRIAPDALECNQVREALSTDPTALPADTDVHVIANLIKHWFRKLPEKLLAAVPPDEVVACVSGAASMQLLSSLPLQHLGVVLWLLDLMADVAAMQEHNKMSDRAIAIVIAPNLYDCPDSKGPMEVMIFSQQMAKFLLELLHHYSAMRTRRRSLSGADSPPWLSVANGAVEQQAVPESSVTDGIASISLTSSQMATL